jgi:hypothetical protein
MVMAKSEARSLTVRQQKGRAVNAVAELLEKRLAVPNIYLEPRSPYISTDVLAVDRAGSGDLHAVEIKLEDELRGKSTVAAALDPKRWMQTQIKATSKVILAQLMALPAHYRYLAIPEASFDLVMGELGPVLYPPDGIGRIGIIKLIDQGQAPPIAELSSITPERFRVSAEKLSRIEKNLINNKKVRPDIEVRI